MYFCGIHCNVSSFSFIILSIPVFFLIWLKVCQFYLSKNQLLISLIISVLFLVSISFIYVIPFLLLNVGCSFFSSLRDKVRLLEISFLNVDIYCYNIFLKLLLLYPIGFGMLCFNLCYIQGGFLIFFLVSSVTHCLFRSMLFDFHLLVKISAFFLLLISSFIPLWLGKK